MDRARLRGTLTYRALPTLWVGLEYSPLADNVEPVVNWLAITETKDRPALVFGLSSDRIGTTHGQAYSATLSKDIEQWTGLPIAPYAGISYGTFDDQLDPIAGLYVRWSEKWSSTHLWDGHNLHHLIETTLGERQSIGFLIVELEGDYDLGLNYSISF